MRILLIEDEEELAQAVARGLQKCGYAVDTAFSAGEALDYWAAYRYDVTVLDLTLPDMDGLALLGRLREAVPDARILILSARSAVSDRVKGLDLGANDYLVKPFDFLELEARIRSLGRLRFTEAGDTLRCGGLTLDLAAREARFNGSPVSFTRKEFGILEYLLLHKNEAVPASRIIDHVWDSDADLYPDSLKYHIHSIKKKLLAAGAPDPLVQNVRGVGYKAVEK